MISSLTSKVQRSVTPSNSWWSDRWSWWWWSSGFSGWGGSSGWGGGGWWGGSR